MARKYQNVQKGSFRGAQFETFDAELTFGRRNVVHEYPLKDEPFSEDLGRKAREYTFNCYVIGDDYYGARDALINAIENDDSPGTLVHPTLGSILVVPKDCRHRFNNQEGGLEYFTLTFAEAGTQSFPSGGIDTGFLSGLYSTQAITQLISFFASTFATLNKPDFLYNSALSQLIGSSSSTPINNGSFTSLVSSVLRSGSFGSSNSYYTETQEALTSFDTSVTSDLDTPSTLATNVSDIITKVTDTFLNQPIEVDDVATYISTVRPNHPENSALEAQKRLQEYGADFLEISLTTSQRIQQAINQQQLINLILHCSLCEMIRITSVMEFASRQDALEVRDSVDEYIRARLVVLADNGDDVPFIAMSKSRAAMIKDINTRAATLKNKKYVMTGDAVPAIVFAYDQYGDATQDEDIVRRNKIRNPVFIPPLSSVEILV